MKPTIVLRTTILRDPDPPGYGTCTHIMGLLHRYPNTLILREIRISVLQVRSLISLSLRQKKLHRVLLYQGNKTYTRALAPDL